MTSAQGDFREEIRQWTAGVVPCTASRRVEVRVVSGPWVRKSKGRGYWAYDGEVMRGVLRAGLGQDAATPLEYCITRIIIASAMYWVDLRRFAMEAADLGLPARHVVINGRATTFREVPVPRQAVQRFDYALRVLGSDGFRERIDAIFDDLWIVHRRGELRSYEAGRSAIRVRFMTRFEGSQGGAEPGIDARTERV